MYRFLTMMHQKYWLRGQKCCSILVTWATAWSTGCFCQGGQVAEHKGLRDAELAWYSSSVTCCICLYGLNQNLGIHVFRPSWPYLIVEVLATRAKFIDLSSYCAFTLHPKNDFACFWDLGLSLNSKTKGSQIGLLCKIIRVVLKARTEWINSQRVSGLTTLILPTSADTFHGLNWSGLVIYSRQTSLYRNIAKLLTPQRIDIVFFLLVIILVLEVEVSL